MPLIKPFLASRKFYATIGDGTGTGEDFAIAATSFLDDTGAAITEFPGSFAYYVLYINAMPQTADVSTLTTVSLAIPSGDMLDGDTPVMIEVVVN